MEHMNSQINTSDLFSRENYNDIESPNLESYRPSNSLYLKEDLFVKYFDVIMLENLKRFNSKVCPFKSMYITDYFITLDFINFAYKIPQQLRKSINSCNITNYRFYVIPLRINFNYKDAHSNLIIVDNKLFTIEFFEPHGSKFGGFNYELPYNIESHIKNLIEILFPITNIIYTFRNVQNSCPKGLQQKQSEINPKGGHCLAWSLLFINLRIINLEHDTNYIIKYLHSIQNLDDYIRRYVSYLENISHLLEFKMYPTLEYKMKLSSNELDNINNRIKFLLENYTDLSLTINKSEIETKNINKYFQELISYHKVKHFDDIFFKYFNEYALNQHTDTDTHSISDTDTHSISDDDSSTDTYTSVDNNSYNNKRKASISSENGISSEDEHIDNLYENYN